MDPINLFEYEALARERIDPVAWAYYRSGSEDEVTLRENRAAYERIRLRPRMLVPVGACDTATTALGTPIAAPILAAPTAYQGMIAPRGEALTAAGVGAAGTVMCVSTMSTTSLEDVAATATGPLWFQLYVYRDREVTESLVRRAERAGYRALVVTVDMPFLGRREDDIRNGFGLPPGLTLANFTGALADEPRTTPGESSLATYAAHQLNPNLTWEGIDWLRSITSLPVVLKGILTAEDAELAVAHGAAAIIVSNHGGRQLDGAMPTIEALPEVVEAVSGRVEVYVDGGIRRGTDVLKALALGARAALVGRPILWGLGVDGSAGVTRVLSLLQEELRTAMALAGRPTLASIDRSLVRLP